MSENACAKVKVVATRPPHQNAAWQSKLQSSGFKVIPLSLMEIKPPSSEQQRKARAKIQNVDFYDHLIFVSQNAVQYAFSLIDELWPTFPQNVTLWAIGEKTKKSIEKHCQTLAISASIQYIVPAKNDVMTSEALLQHPDLHTVSNAKILICRGLGGRTLLGDALLQRGARVEYCELYERRVPLGLSQQIVHQLGDCVAAEPETRSTKDKCEALEHHFVILPVFSFEALQNFNAAASNEFLDKDNIVVVCPSERVSRLASELGFINLVSARNATEESMLKAIEGLAVSRGQ